MICKSPPLRRRRTAWQRAVSKAVRHEGSLQVAQQTPILVSYRQLLLSGQGCAAVVHAAALLDDQSVSTAQKALLWSRGAPWYACSHIFGFLLCADV